MKCHSTSVPMTTASTARTTTSGRAGIVVPGVRRRRRDGAAPPAREIVASAPTTMATNLRVDGVDEKRLSISAVTCSPSGAAPSRSLKMPTICGRRSPSTTVGASWPAAPKPAVVRVESDDTTSAQSAGSWSSGDDSSTLFRNSTSTPAGPSGVAGFTLATSPYLPASAAPRGRWRSRIPPRSASSPTAEQGICTSRLSGA